MDVILQDDIMKKEEKFDSHSGHMIYNRFDAVSLGLIIGCILCIFLVGHLVIKWNRKRLSLQTTGSQQKEE